MIPRQPVSVSERLRSKKEQILNTWEELVRKEIPEAKDQDKAAIRNSLPKFLDKVVLALSKGPTESMRELASELSVAAEHGEQRIRFDGYSMQQVIREYQLLRIVTFKSLEEDVPLEQDERDVVLNAISFGEQAAATTFHRIQLKAQIELKNRTSERDQALLERDLSYGQVGSLISEREMREIFVSSLAHDLRTPITAARMNVELLLRRRVDVGALEIHAGRALGELTRLEGMIQDLLDANRIQAGQMLPIKVSEFELCEAVQESLDMLTSVHGDRFEFEPAEKVKGSWDKTGIRRILDNLCSNAIKYGNKTTPIIVSVVANPTVQTVELRVQNKGPIISPEDQKKMFKQFHRTRSAERGASHGWGIGLALVRGMAEAHGGTVGVESSADNTTFSVVLPLDARL